MTAHSCTNEWNNPPTTWPHRNWSCIFFFYLDHSAPCRIKLLRFSIFVWWFPVYWDYSVAVCCILSVSVVWQQEEGRWGNTHEEMQHKGRRTCSDTESVFIPERRRDLDNVSWEVWLNSIQFSFSFVFFFFLSLSFTIQMEAMSANEWENAHSLILQLLKNTLQEYFFFLE